MNPATKRIDNRLLAAGFSREQIEIIMAIVEAELVGESERNPGNLELDANGEITQ